jgi:hypothetical protein
MPWRWFWMHDALCHIMIDVRDSFGLDYRLRLCSCGMSWVITNE